MLTESTLKDLLNTRSLVQADTVLCCLAIQPDTPKPVKVIRALAAKHGVAEIRNWNVQALLAQSNKFAFRTAEGWELTTEGLAHVEALLGAIEKRSVVSGPAGESDPERRVPVHRVLLVQADAHTMQLLEFMFTRANYQVLTAVNGREAQAFINDQPAVDLMVTALTLPYVTGYQVIIDARQSRAWMNVPIIVLSGKVLEMDVVRALDTGANDYVTKPFRPRELLARARGLIATNERLGKAK